MVGSDPRHRAVDCNRGHSRAGVAAMKRLRKRVRMSREDARKALEHAAENPHPESEEMAEWSFQEWMGRLDKIDGGYRW